MITNLCFGGNKVTGDIVLPGSIEGKLILTFEDTSGLDSGNLSLLAELVDPLDPQLLARMPAGVFIPSDFPVLVTIEPSGGSTLSFRGRWSLELVSENLEFSSHTPYRLFRSSGGLAFQDISVGLGSGSLRALGVASDFSEFLIADDPRPVDSVIGEKHMRLHSVLDDTDGTIPAALLAALQGKLQTARQSYVDGRLGDAVAEYKLFVAAVLAATSGEIPDEWTPGGAMNLAGRLRALGRTLIFSVIVEALIFEDGFESGDITAWSSTVP